jgi:hypothetical protein
MANVRNAATRGNDPEKRMIERIPFPNARSMPAARRLRARDKIAPLWRDLGRIAQELHVFQ